MSESKRRMHHFALLTPDEKQAAILRMPKSGMSIHTIAAATQLSIEMVKTILADNNDARMTGACKDCE